MKLIATTCTPPLSSDHYHQQQHPHLLDKPLSTAEKNQCVTILTRYSAFLPVTQFFEYNLLNELLQTLNMKIKPRKVGGVG